MQRRVILGGLFLFSLLMCLPGTVKLLGDTIILMTKGEFSKIKKEWSDSFWIFTLPGVIFREFFSPELQKCTSA